MVPLGIDREKMMLQLERLEEHLERLLKIRAKLQASKDDTFFSAAERLLQVSIEDCLNIGNHIISGLGLRRPDTYREIFSRLKEAKIISGKIGDAMEGLASFRNRLVHLYWKVSNEEIMEKLEDIDVLKKFVAQISKYVENN
ncbi:MAG: DUF86 domain-containing protein [Candidatus Omnitrophota bacterium]